MKMTKMTFDQVKVRIVFINIINNFLLIIFNLVN